MKSFFIWIIWILIFLNTILLWISYLKSENIEIFLKKYISYEIEKKFEKSKELNYAGRKIKLDWIKEKIEKTIKETCHTCKENKTEIHLYDPLKEKILEFYKKTLYSFIFEIRNEQKIIWYN